MKEKLTPAIVQDQKTGRVLMLGYVNDESLQVTRETGRMTFFSRSKQRLWTKGEESGNYLYVREILNDCDSDALLVKADPAGPVCHTGTDTCWGERNVPFIQDGRGNEISPGGGGGSGADSGITGSANDSGITGSATDLGAPGSAYEFIAELERVIESRRGADPESSYTAKLLAGGPRKISKKLGEESAELIIESMDNRDDLFLNEAADLLYHYLVLLRSRDFSLNDVEAILRERHK
jgi:phosphoribosyl-AMP cyclohydrolase / phosphoribosyl-ATP pyrophosphohydrolase